MHGATIKIMIVVSMTQHNKVVTDYLQCDFLLMNASKYITEGTMYCGFYCIRLTVFTAEIMNFYSLLKNYTEFSSNL